MSTAGSSPKGPKFKPEQATPLDGQQVLNKPSFLHDAPVEGGLCIQASSKD